MRVEVLFVPGCPNYKPALERVKNVLVLEGLDVEVHGVPINAREDATALMFPGSPTIRIDGVRCFMRFVWRANRTGTMMQQKRESGP